MYTVVKLANLKPVPDGSPLISKRNKRWNADVGAGGGGIVASKSCRIGMAAKGMRGECMRLIYGLGGNTIIVGIPYVL